MCSNEVLLGRGLALLLFLLLCPLCQAGELEDIRLLACSTSDQTASFRLPDGQIVLATSDQPFHETLRLEKVLDHRVVLIESDPKASQQFTRYWIDIREGIDNATVQKVGAIPDKKPVMVKYHPPTIIPVGDNAGEVLMEIPSKAEQDEDN